MYANIFIDIAVITSSGPAVPEWLVVTVVAGRYPERG
jgi:hypothetical protein